MRKCYPCFSQHKPHEHVVTIALETLPSKDFFPLFVQLVIRRLMDALVVLVFPHQSQTDDQAESALQIRMYTLAHANEMLK